MGSSIGTLVGDNQRVDAVVAEHRGTAAIQTDCQLLVSDAEAADVNLPSPDADLTQVLNEAYQLEVSAGGTCSQAGAGSTALLARSTRDRRQAQNLLDEALSRFHSLSGMTLSTTTTTSPDAGDEPLG